VNGVFSGHLGTLADITDLKRHRDQLAAAQKVDSLGSLAAGVAHNFNNLLATILMDADLALSDVPPDSPACESIERISQVAIRGSEVVKLLEAYAGSSEAAPEEVDLSRLAGEAIASLRLSFPKNVVLETALAQDVPAIRVNAGQIRQMIVHLITNAAEALNKQAGTIHVTTGQVRLSADGPENLPEGEYVRLEVSDTGSGISEEAQTRVFDPFYTTKFLGRGLGLAAVQGIVRSHGGAVNAVSTPGKGSTFEVLLPSASLQSEEI
jgi:signal transduction histidine kinase